MPKEIFSGTLMFGLPGRVLSNWDRGVKLLDLSGIQSSFFGVKNVWLVMKLWILSDWDKGDIRVRRFPKTDISLFPTVGLGVQRLLYCY